VWDTCRAVAWGEVTGSSASELSEAELTQPAVLPERGLPEPVARHFMPLLQSLSSEQNLQSRNPPIGC